MKTLYLLRHAAALASPALSDHARTLTPVGEAEARAVGAHMKALAPPQAVLCSSSARTVQTARIVLSELGLQDVSVEEARALYLATPDMLMEQVAGADDAAGALLVVGHNPGIFELAYRLSRGTMADHTQDFPTATLAVFRVDAPSWSEAAPANMQLESVFIPPPAP